jgi:hypothetical protein
MVPTDGDDFHADAVIVNGTMPASLRRPNA